MSRLIANSADEMLADPYGTNSDVMGSYYSTDGEVPGVVVLGSTNAMPNPDLTDTDVRGRVRAWDQNAPPAPDSWNVYMRQMTNINGAGTHVVIANPTPMMRQNTSLLRVNQTTYVQDHPLLNNKTLTDLGQDELTDLAPPTEAPRVDVITTAGNVGYPAATGGALWASYFGIIGNNPMTTSRITSTAPAIALPAIAQGQSLLFYIPSEIPDSWTGVGFCVGPAPSTMRVQTRVDIRGRIETTTVDRGPYRRDSRVINTTTNYSMMGAYKQYGAPIAWRTHDGLNLHPGTYLLSYKLLTKQGPTASQDVNTVQVANFHEGEALAWAPPKAILRKEGIRGWIPEFRAMNGHWYTFEEARGNGYSLQREARLHTKYTDKDHWKRSNGPVKQDRSEKDRSGVAGPTDAMETPLPQGSEAMKPGRYSVRLTTANQEMGMESAPSPGTIVTLRDAGLFAGGAASGVTDQSVRVMRPMPQLVKNSRFVEIDPATGQPNLHWETPAVGSVTVTEGDGLITVSDTTALTTNTTIRRSSIERVDPTRYYAFRFRINVTSWTSGSIRISVRFLDSAKATISTTALSNFREVLDIHAYKTLGPENGTAHFDIPPTTAYAQLEIVHAGAASDGRNFAYSMSNIGMWIGRAVPQKLYDLVLAEDTPGRDVWPVPEDETVATGTGGAPYPPGPYVRTVTSPLDPAKVRSVSYKEQKGFEDNSLTNAGPGTTLAGAWTTSIAGGMNFNVGTAYALRGEYGAQIVTQAGGGSSTDFKGSIWKDFRTVTSGSIGLQLTYRVKRMLTAGTVKLLGFTRTGNFTDWAAYVLLSSTGQLNLAYWNATTLAYVLVPVSGVTVSTGDDLQLELIVNNYNTASGTATLIVKRNNRPTVQAQALSIPWTGITPNRTVVGIQNGDTIGANITLLLDRIRVTNAGMNETGNIPGSLVQYWAPEKQPAHDPAHFITGARWPVKPGQTRTFSCHVRYQGITTPSEGAKLFKLVSFNANGQPVKEHGYVINGLYGRDYWDRYSMTYTTASVEGGDEDAAYVQVVRNEIGDGAVEAMGFQDEVGSSMTAFTNTHDTSGSFSAIFDTTIENGPLDASTKFNTKFLRARTVATEDTGQAVTLSVRAGNSLPLSGTFVTASVTNVQALATTNRYVELLVGLTTTDATKSPEVRAVFLDVQRPQPVLLMQDGRDFDGGILVYGLTPGSFRPNVVRKEFADGSVGHEYVGRNRPGKVLKMSLEALTEEGKRQAEINPATDEPYYQVETDTTRYTVAMVPEFAGSQESQVDGTYYFDYVAESIEADVIAEDTL